MERGAIEPGIAGATILTRIAGTVIVPSPIETAIVRIAGDEAAVVDAYFTVGARAAIERAPATVGDDAALLGRTCRLRAATPLVADLPLRARRDTGAG